MQQDILAFYSKSRDVHAGKGASECVETPELYSELNSIADWRKVLSNFHVSTQPFIFNQKTYRTIEHAFQASKIALVDPVKADAFSMESGSVLSVNGTGLDAQKQRKMVLLSKEKLEEWDNIKDAVMRDASISKYSVCELSQKVLKATRNTK